MKNINDVTKKRIDTTIKIVLIMIIIILLIHNCVLQKKDYQNKPIPNGNVDIIEIDCNDGNKCKPIPPSTPKPTNKKITSLSFASENISVKKGDKQKLIVLVKPSSLASSKFTWKSSDPSIASVDEFGNITGLKEGTVTITITSSNGVSTKCKVHVTLDSIAAEKIILTPEKMTVKVGESEQISAKIEPENSTERDLVWSSSDEKIAKVDENGVVTGLKSGQVVITAKTKDGKVSSTCIVTIENVDVNKIILEPTKMTLKVGESEQISAKIEPENATERNLVWTSSDESIATVTGSGIVKGLKPGKVSITAKIKDGKVESVCSVTVEPIEVNKIILTPTKMYLKEATSGQIFAQIEPEKATDKELVWTSSDSSVATVDKNGVVTGIKEGTVTITAKTKDGKVASTCTVEITNDYVEVSEIILNTESTNIATGTFEPVIATIKPDNATDRELVWSSSDESIATVDSTGKVTGITSGVVTITAKTRNGKVVATINLTINNVPDGKVEVYDNDKDPVTWNGSDDLNIFSNSIYNINGVIAPESENTYQFVVRNNTKYKIKYSIDFIETNDYHINMKYKLKKNDSYIVNSYSKPNSLAVKDYVLNSGENDTYYLDWKWISNNNDTEIGSNPEAIYKLKIEVKAESING